MPRLATIAALTLVAVMTCCVAWAPAAGSGSLSDVGLHQIENWEMFRAFPYDNDGGGNCTVGYGHLIHVGRCTTADRARYPNGVTREQAEAQARLDVAKAVTAINRCVRVPLSQQQFDQLVDFTFNIGGGALCGSTLVKLLNRGDYGSVPGQMARWKYSGGKESAGLVRRRKATGTLFGTQPPAAGTCVVDCTPSTGSPPGGTGTPGTGSPPGGTVPVPRAPTARLGVAIFGSSANTNHVAGLGVGSGSIKLTYADQTYECGARGSGSCGPIQVPIGAQITATATPTDDSTFIGWTSTDCDAQAQPCSFTMGTGSDLTANFGVNTYFLTLNNPNKEQGQILKSGGAAGNIICGLNGDNDECTQVDRRSHPISITFVGKPGFYKPTAVTGCDAEYGQGNNEGEAFCTNIVPTDDLTIGVTWEAVGP